MIRGKKIKIPTPKAESAASNTPPAAKSFAFLIDGFRSLHTTSDNVSMALFTASSAKTNPITVITANHSAEEMEKNNPDTTANTAKNK